MLPAWRGGEGGGLREGEVESGSAYCGIGFQGACECFGHYLHISSGGGS
jgi:hypothetical protein